MTPRLAFTGIGKMGLPMALHLLSAGFALSASNRSLPPLLTLGSPTARWKWKWPRKPKTSSTCCPAARRSAKCCPYQ
ncbi:NAD(P)-binding domain-containing protein [Deinococcus rubellus]|uniref:NAD(P)-binding domain-containing protein n=1 Tax=Deinococcus rubellus TaxID=1889240 RepID=UPI003CD05976